MAGLEVVVRPVVFPDIRPAPARSLRPADDPEKGFAIIKGNGAKQVDLNYSFTWTFSKSKMVETKRRVDQARVYQKEKDGTINKENFVDMDVANKIWSEGGKSPSSDVGGGATGGAEGGGATGGAEGGGGTMSEREIRYYKPVVEKDNIEIKKRNVIIDNPK